MPAYQVSRSVEIQCDPEQAFEAVSNYRTWTTWSPWLIAEPEAKVTISQNASSIGSTYAWDGKVTGAGELEHQVLERGKRIEDELRFKRPFKTVCQTSFHFAPSRFGTKVTWNMNAKLPWFMFWMIPMMKTFIAMDYQRGLAMLKDWIETGSIPSRCSVHGKKSIGPVRMAGVVGRCSVFDVGSSMEQAFEQARSEFRRLGLPSEGEMISVYTRFRMGAGEFEYISGWMIPPAVEVKSPRLKVWTLPAGPAFQVDHVGSYRHLGNGWGVANQLVRHQKLKQQRTGTFEIYRTTPPDTPEDEFLTEIYLPLRQ
ncbi:MAG: SRPBCC family protein [Planctomycetaceae bacterium]|nr:SRPBCC family protein [Planctomycetaceae bacterium]